MVSVILAGGENKRFPYLKGFIETGGRRIIESNIEILTSVTDSIVISTNTPEHYFYLGVPLIGDIITSAGPMSGIYSALYSTKSDAVFVSACDMPFLNKALIEYIITNADKEATVPVYNGKAEPLFGVYSSALLQTMENMIEHGRTSMYHMLDEVDVKYIDEDEIRGIDPEGLSFININTIDDFDRHARKRDREVPARRT